MYLIPKRILQFRNQTISGCWSSISLSKKKKCNNNFNNKKTVNSSSSYSSWFLFSYSSPSLRSTVSFVVALGIGWSNSNSSSDWWMKRKTETIFFQRKRIRRTTRQRRRRRKKNYKIWPFFHSFIERSKYIQQQQQHHHFYEWIFLFTTNLCFIHKNKKKNLIRR